MMAKKKSTKGASTEKLRKEAMAEIGARIDAEEPAAEPTPAKTKKDPAAKKPVREKKPKAEKPKRIGALSAAVRVLTESGKPLRSGELIDLMAERGYWSSPNGRTPAATLYAAMIREIKNKGKEARFRQVGPGQFALAK